MFKEFKKKNMKEHQMIKTVNKMKFQSIQKEIESYGYHYSLKNFIYTIIISIFILFMIAFYIQLQFQYIIMLIMTLIIILPVIIKSHFKTMYQIKRFEMIVTYLDNIIPIFKRTPLIALSLKEVLDLLDGEMKECVNHAYHILMNNTEDAHVIKTAFQCIEEHFPNSRIHSVHQMMYTIVTQNTSDYLLSVDNMWLDVQAWIRRVTSFQNELKDRKTKLLILTMLTALSNCLFVSMYSSNEIFSSFTHHIIYQISSTCFLITLMIVVMLFQVKLSGEWLLDDQSIKEGKKAMKCFAYITNYSIENKQRHKMIVSIILCLLALFCMIKGQMILSVLCVFIAYMLISQEQRIYKTNLKHIKKYLQIEFPMWMRDISLNLVNLTVLNAIEVSKETSSLIMSYYIDELLERIQSSPTSIQPYNEFLSEFCIEGVKSSMKVLYSLQSLDSKEMQNQTSFLIIRNQEMLDRSEAIKNQDALTGVKLLGFVPVSVFVVQMLISMGLLFSVMMNLMSSSMNL